MNATRLIRLGALPLLLACLSPPIHVEQPVDIQALKKQCEQADANAIAHVRNPTNDELDKRLRDAVEQAFELRQQLHTAQIELARENLDQASKLLEERLQSRDQLIQTRIEQLRRSGIPTSAPEKENTNRPVPLKPTKPDSALENPASTNATLRVADSLLQIKIETVPATIMRDINRDLSTNYRGGLNVVKLDAVTLSETHGLREGDILIGIDRWRTTNDSELAAALGSALNEDKPTIPFYVARRVGDGGDMGLGDMGMGDMGMEMSMGGVAWRLFRGELNRDPLRVKRDRSLEEERARYRELIREHQQQKKSLLEQEIDERSLAANLPAPVDDPRARELVTDLTLAQATLDEFSKLVEDTSIERTEFLARLSELLEDESVRGMTSPTEEVIQHFRAVLQQRVAGLQRKVEALRTLADQERERQLQKRRDEEEQRIAAIVRVLDEEIAQFERALELLQ